MITSGEGKYKVFLEKKEIDNDLIYILGGGERSHIGGVVMCELDKEPQIIRLEGHYDDIVLKPIAVTACKKYNKKVAAIGGVHVDNATEEEINLLVKNCKDLAEKL
ncbi:MAG: hypothetical protein KAR55_05210 [Thermoplasmatales archaeon]|nr:hypothetical protein [Thermoplasmatales archaeon]